MMALMASNAGEAGDPAFPGAVNCGRVRGYCFATRLAAAPKFWFKKTV